MAERSLPNDGNRPGGKRRYLPAAERKREILEAAVEEFSIGGFAAPSLERIAVRAG
ncbi:MAG: TetR family transcriptional regulator, partial [Lautropia mirabilis]|nr:TetR family transcriptional regulator [Lautropia mirabilis]